MNMRKSNQGPFVGVRFRNQMIVLMNRSHQLLDNKERFEYINPSPYISRQFLPPLPQQILSNTASEAPDGILEEQKTDLDYDPKLS
jgi:hypothetical protein